MVKFINEWRAEIGHKRYKAHSPVRQCLKEVTFEIKTPIECLKDWKKKKYRAEKERSELSAVHIFGKPRVWEPKHEGKNLRFRRYHMPLDINVDRIIEIVREGKSADGWALSEVFEVGNGKWEKGTTIKYDSSKAELSIKEFGWDADRGKDLPPVWLCVHRHSTHFA